MPSARVYNSAAISITSGTLTALTFDTERYDNDAIHSVTTNTGRLTCVTAGRYVITGSVEFTAGAGTYRLLEVLLNGATIISSLRVPPPSSGLTRLSIATQYNLAATDYVELRVQHDVGSAINVNSSGNYSPEFAMALLGS